MAVTLGQTKVPPSSVSFFLSDQSCVLEEECKILSQLYLCDMMTGTTCIFTVGGNISDTVHNDNHLFDFCYFQRLIQLRENKLKRLNLEKRLKMHARGLNMFKIC